MASDSLNLTMPDEAAPAAATPPVGAPTEIPSTDEGLAGQLLFLDPGGHVVPLPREYASAAGRLGYTPASPQQAQDFVAERAFHEKYGTTGQTAAAFAESALSALTFGGSRWAERGLDIASAEEQSARQHVNPIASGLGTAAGLAVPIALTAGAAAPAEAAAGAGALQTAAGLSAPSLIARAGQATRSAVQATLGEGSTAVGRIVSKALQTGAGSGVESAAYALGHEVSEAALGKDPNWTAEAAVARVGMAGALGLGLGAAGSGAWNLGAEVLGPLNVKDKLAGALERVQGMAALRATGGATKGEMKKIGRIIGVENVSKLGADAQDMGLVRAGMKPAEIFSKAGEKLDDLAPRFEGMKAQVDGALQGEQPTVAELVGRATQEISENPAYFDSVLDAGAKTKFNAILADELAANADKTVPSFSDLHYLRHALGERALGIKGYGDPERNEIVRALWGFRGIVNDEMDQAISASSLGKEALAQWKGLNREWHVATQIRDLAGHGMETALGNARYSLTDQIVGGAAGAGSLAGELAAAAGEELPKAIEHGAVTGIPIAIAHKLARTYGQGALAETAGLAKRTLQGEGLGAVGRVLGQEAEMGLGNVTAGMAGRLMRGAAAEGALGALADNTGAQVQADRIAGGGGANLTDLTPIGDDPEKVAILAELERTQNDVEDQILKGVGSIVRGTRGDQTVRGESLPGIPASFAKPADTAASLFKKRVAALQLYDLNPNSLHDTLLAQTNGWYSHAPNTAAAMNALTARGVSYLLAGIPQPPEAYGMLDGPYEPNGAQVGSFNLKWEAVNKPLSILHQAAAGTLVPESVDAVANVYPTLYQKMRLLAFQKVAEAGGKVPYTQRLMLSMLTNIPMDGSLAASSVVTNQARYQALSGQGLLNPPPGRAKGGGKKPQMRLASRTRTTTQSAAARDEEEKES